MTAIDFPYKSSLDFSVLCKKLGVAKLCSDNTFSSVQKILDSITTSETTFSETIDESLRKKIARILEEALLPKVGIEPMISAHLPFQLESIFQSKTFYSNLGRYLDEENLSEELQVQISRNKIVFAGTEILRQIYGIELGKNPGFQRIIMDEFGFKHAFQIVFDSTLLSVSCDDTPPEIEPFRLDELRNDFYNLDLWLSLLPAAKFSFSGLTLVKATDISVEYLMSDLRDGLLTNNALGEHNSFDFLKKTVSSILQKKDISLGVMPYNTSRKRFTDNNLTRWRGLLPRNFLNETQAAQVKGSLLFRAKETSHLVYASCLQSHPNITVLEEEYRNNNFLSILIAPMQLDGEFLGFMEIASPHSNGISPFDLSIIDKIVPLFALVMKRDRDQLSMQIQTIIKENCSILHPSVEWRFEKEAKNLLRKKRTGPFKMNPIYFREIYPLYYAADIRGSSTERSNAIRADLTEHLTRAKDYLQLALSRSYVPIVDELLFKVNRHLARLNDILDSNDEIEIGYFLKSRLNDGILLLLSRELLSEEEVTQYFSFLDPEHQVIYGRRKEFEDAIRTINAEISHLLDEEEVSAQKIFPHFFEKYKTDGVDYNMYIGGSITAHETFNKEYLSNFRLWQLLVSCKIEGLTYSHFDKLPLRLSLTHLILVHSSPMTIRFNPDEKKFDVEGSYNIRYEIIKKRIDKARVKGTEERITQSGKLSVVYSAEAEKIEYTNYFRFLSAKDIIKDSIEDIEIEELPGATGLRALRVTFNPKFFEDSPKRDASFLNTIHLVPS